MLSKRGTKSAESETIPWRFAPGGSNRYDKTTNPTGIIPFGSAENDLVREELHQFISQNVRINYLELHAMDADKSLTFERSKYRH